MSVCIFLVGVMLMSFGFAFLGFLGSSSYKKIKPQYFGRTFIIGLFLLITGAFALVSPFYIVYPYYPFSKDVISVEDNGVVYHRWGTWRKQNVLSICADGTLHTPATISVWAIKGKLVGRMSLIGDITVVDIRSYFKAFPERREGCASMVSDYELHSRVKNRQWDFLKEYINQGFPEDKEYAELIKKHFDPLRLQGIEMVVKVDFDPTYMSANVK